VGAAFGLFSVWWGVSLLAYLATGRVWSGEEWMASSAQAWIGVGLGGFVGLGATAAVVLAARQWRIARLMGDNVRGVACSIGRLPINFERPVEAKELPDKASLRLPPPEYDPKGKINRDWMDEWFKTYEPHHPEHAALMRAVARVLNSKPDLPAACNRLADGTKQYHYGYDQHRHGDHTLLEHSWSCASVGIWLTKNGFEYEGVEFKEKYKEAVGFIGKKDDSYQFKDYDPLIGLICFAHDIGKIETFRMRADKTVEVIEPAHDSVGARMLTRMDEFWELPFEDRMTLTLAIGHYHKPSEMPLRRDADAANKAVALSDRTMAMLNLVILSDEEAGAIENKKKETEGKNRPKEIIEGEYRANLWDAFRDLLNESQRVHTEPSKFRIGQKNTVAEGTIITLKEGDLRKELLSKMQLRKSAKEGKAASGAAQITEDLLEVLDEKGCLIKSSGGVEVPAKQAIWKVEFLGKDKNRLGDVIATWPYAILINPEEHFPKLAEAQDAQSLPRVTAIADKDSMLEEKKPKVDAPKSAFTEAPLIGPDGGYVLAEGTKDKGGKGKKKPAEQHAVARQGGEQASSENVVDLDEARKTKVRAAEQVPTTARNDGPALEAGTEEGEAELRQAGHQAAQQQAQVTEPAAAVSGGQEPAQVQASKALAGLMDELDPVVEQPQAVKQVQEQVPAQAKAPEVEKTVVDGEAVQANPASTKDRVAIVQTLLKSKLNDGGAAAAPAQVEAPQKSVIADREIPEDVMELARSMRASLAKINTATSSNKLAAEELKDGRVAYSLEALGAVVPEIKAQLNDAAMLRRLMEAAKFGTKVPVCVVYRSGSGVTLVVINNAEVKKVIRRQTS
jgi:hypothetical protein